jgi:hypothetical protein
MGVSVDISTEGADEIRQALESFSGKAKDQAAKVLNEVADKADKIATRNLTAKGAIGISGALRASVAVRKYASTDDLSIVVGAGDAETEQDGFDYSLAVEFGTRPHFPPVEAVTGKTEPLDRWVEVKAPASPEEGQDQEEADRQKAFLIARKISRVGQKERPYMRPARNQARALLRRTLPKLLKRIDP